MTSTTEETWTFSGYGSSLELTTYAHGIELVDSGTADLGSSPIQRAYTHGGRFRRRWRGVRSLGLVLWVNECDADGVLASTATARLAQLRDNISELSRLLNYSRSEVTVVRKMRTGSGLISLTGKGVFANSTGIRRDPSGLGFTRMVADFEMVYPWFYGGTILNTTIAEGGTETLNHHGDVDTDRLSIIFSGPLTNPEISNDSLGIALTFNGTVGASEVVTVNVLNRTVNSSSTGSLATTTVTHTGDPAWFLLQPGDNDLSLSADSGSGSVQVTGNATYLG